MKSAEVYRCTVSYLLLSVRRLAGRSATHHRSEETTLPVISDVVVLGGGEVFGDWLIQLLLNIERDGGVVCGSGIMRLQRRTSK